jgi:hypothetical protein
MRVLLVLIALTGSAHAMDDYGTNPKYEPCDSNPRGYCPK